MSYERTLEHRLMRSRLIQQWKPWKRSTGPKTTEGKKTAARNVFKGARRPTLQSVRQTLAKSSTVTR